MRSGLQAFRGWKRRSDLALRHVRRVDRDITQEKLRAVGLELPILALNLRLGNVAWRATFDLR